MIRVFIYNTTKSNLHLHSPSPSHYLKDIPGQHRAPQGTMSLHGKSPDDDYFYSSPEPPPGRRGPEDEVSMLVDRASQVQSLSPSLHQFMALHGPAFLNLFGRQIQLIQSRSQAFEDAHVTVFDKTLLTLTHNGRNLDNPAAIQYFCHEFLGINTEGSVADCTRPLQQALDVSQELKSGKSHPDLLGCSCT